MGASYRTQNFIVNAPTPEFAAEVGETAEQQRKELAILWLGREMDPWGQPCPIVVQVGEHLGAGGATSFVFHSGEVFDWRMNIQGSRKRLLDSVLPHEITHTVFATHFRQPLPRWADEGACTTVEHPEERIKQQRMLIEFLKTGRGIAFSDMFAMSEYPADVLPLYAQGHSLARFLIEQGGRHKYVNYVADGLATRNWPATTERHYGFKNLANLQDQWLAWVRGGSHPLSPENNLSPEASSPVQLADASLPGPGSDVIYRGQNPGRLASALGKLNPLKRRSRTPDDPFANLSMQSDNAPEVTYPTPAQGVGTNQPSTHAAATLPTVASPTGGPPMASLPANASQVRPASGTAPIDDGSWRPSAEPSVQPAGGPNSMYPQQRPRQASHLAPGPGPAIDLTAHGEPTAGPREVLLEWTREQPRPGGTATAEAHPAQGGMAPYFDGTNAGGAVYRR
jgi:hypothetical protein